MWQRKGKRVERWAVGKIEEGKQGRKWEDGNGKEAEEGGVAAQS